MKFPLAWHRAGLENARHSLASEVTRMANQQTVVDRLKADIELTERQIAEAERRGLVEFDRDRLLKKRQ